ncbi:glutamate-rich protein 1 isoform X2 [Notolabrus celidotus]|uniref:glutamate-rich protein 1 isoform X2 n=1 Tax=Notolabrus celidotus TaxID=1203425 RepID=UPI00148FF6E4|nr:glutamate-rich protein 1 isoform X2 [Notolabrus celidotus]
MKIFQTKVLQKLYPVAPKPEKEPKPPPIVESLAKTTVKRKASQVDSTTEDAGKTQSSSDPGRRRLYTVLSPPADYKPHPEKSITLPLLESINSAEDPAESADNSNEDEGEEQKRKRRRRKKKPESSTGQSQTPVDEGGEIISRNKKRKLKKKRHKEKLRSMGLMPPAAALEFTYQKDGVEEEEDEMEDNERRAAEVSEFLRTTTEMYLSDSSSCQDKLPLSGAVDNLLGNIACRDEPTSVLKLLYGLKVLVQQKKIEKLEEALGEFQNTSFLSEEETTAVVALFQYWITDLLPMQGDQTTGGSTMHP